MEHHAEINLSAIRVVTALLFLVKVAGLNIALALPRAQKDVAPPSALYHAPDDVVVLVLVLAICDQVGLGPIRVGDKMCAHEVDRLDQIGVYGERVLRLLVADGADVFGFHAYGIHDADFVDDVVNRYLPIYAFRYPLERLIRRDGVAEFLAAHPRDGIGEQGIAAPYLVSELVANLINGQIYPLFHRLRLVYLARKWYTNPVMRSRPARMWIEK